LDELTRSLDRIEALLADYRLKFLRHPFFAAAHHAKLPRKTLVEFAFHQYSDSILWVPRLSLMKSKVTAPRLARALHENIAHETGLDGPSHIALARAMLRSLGVRSLAAFPRGTFSGTAAMWLSDDFESFDEAEIAGWLLIAETLVPLMFERMLDAMRATGCDTAYFEQHIAVDGDEHSQWMHESIAEILARAGANGTAAHAVEAGMADAFEEAVQVPDRLARALR
jgi:hypothetical protein